MIIHAISDLHGRKPDLLGGDLLIIAGDCTASDTIPEWIDFFEWLETQDYEKKILVGGNHDGFLAQCLSTKKCTELFPEEKGDWKYEHLMDSDTEFKGLKLYGSPHTNLFDNVNPRCKAFMDRDYLIAKYFESIPDDTDILITHSPSLETLDDGKGSYALKKALERVKPLLHVHGHIHTFGGEYLYNNHGTMCVNCAMVDDSYKKQLDYMEIILDDENKIISVTKV